LWDARIGVVCSPNGAGGRGHSQGVPLRVLALGHEGGVRRLL